MSQTDGPMPSENADHRGDEHGVYTVAAPDRWNDSGGPGHDGPDEFDAPPTGANTPVRDIAATVRAALVGTDLLRSGPGLWPFGPRARRRRAHNHDVAEEAARRHAQLRATFDAVYTATTPSAPSHNTDESDSADNGTRTDSGGEARPAEQTRRPHTAGEQAVLMGSLIGLVLATVLIMLALSGPEHTEEASRIPDDPTPSSAPDSTTHHTTTPQAGDQALAPHGPIPPGGITPIPARPGEPLDPRSIPLVATPTTAPATMDLSTPAGAMRAWLARWCPFDYTDPFGTAQRRARPAMTEAGWATLNPDNDTPAADRARVSWETTVAARESGRCAEPAVTISPEAPRTPTSAIAIGTITRVITSETGDGQTQAPYVEQQTEVRIVRRGPDGLWRVDLVATGG